MDGLLTREQLREISRIVGSSETARGILITGPTAPDVGEVLCTLLDLDMAALGSYIVQPDGSSVSGEIVTT